MEPGTYYGLTDDEYDEIDAMRSSALKRWKKSIAHGLEYRREGSGWKAVYDVGKMIHDALLDPHDLREKYVWYDKTKGRRTKTYKRTCRDNGKIGIMPDDVERIQRIREEVDAHPTISNGMLTGGDAEVTLVWVDDETGIRCKARLDYMHRTDEGLIVVDLKSVGGRSSAHPDDVRRRIAKLDYELSASLYVDGCEQVFDKPVIDYVVLSVEKEAPYLCSAVALKDCDLECGRRQYKAGLANVENYEQGDPYHGYSVEIEDVDLPIWKRRKWGIDGE